MAARRYTRRKDGYYATTAWDGTYTDDGRKRRVVLYAKTARELDAKVRELALRVERGDVIKSDGDDLLSLAARWYREEKKGRAASTKQFYKGLIERHLQPLAGVKPDALGVSLVRQILDAAEGRERTQEQILLVLRQVIAYAAREKRMAKSAAAELLDALPTIRHTAAEKRVLTDGEKAAVFSAELPDKEKCFLFLLYGCGLRREEALGLRTVDFDYAGHVTVSRARVLLEGGATDTKGPKSKRGARTLPLPGSIRGVVEEYAKKCDGDLFPDIDKKAYDRFWRRIRRAIEKVCPDSEGLTAHIFRHNYCTELCYQIPTLSVKNVARLLGDTEQMVLNVYSHLDLLREPTDETISEVF